MDTGWASRLRTWSKPTSLVAMIGLALSALVWVAVAAWEDRGAEEQFKATASTKLALFHGGFIDYADVMRFYQGFIDGAAGMVEGEGLEQRAAPILQEYIGLSALEWVPRIRGIERAGFEAAARLNGQKGYRIFRLTASGQRVAAAEHGEYDPILYVTSNNAEDLRTGYDLGSEPTRLDILARARDSGQLAVSDVVPPLMGGDEQQIFAAQAVYAGGSASSPSVSARRLNLIGFAVGVFRLKEMVDGTLKRLTQTDRKSVV
jgi:CHASE1-domain containing sensor protein